MTTEALPRSSPRSWTAPRRRASPASFQAECVVLVHLLRAVRPRHPGAVPRHRAPLRRDLPLPRRDRGGVGSESGHAAGGRAGAGTVAREHARLLRAAQGRAALRRARRLRHVVHRAAPRAVAVARGPAGSRAVQRCRAATTLRKVSPLAALDDRGRVALREGSTTSRCCRSTTPATRASAASRARRCRSTRSNERSGRWGGQKLECGIHIQPTVIVGLELRPGRWPRARKLDEDHKDAPRSIAVPL